MKHFLFFSLFLFAFFACEKEQVDPIDKPVTLFIPFDFESKSDNANLSGFISSPEFRAGLDAMGFHSPDNNVTQISLDLIEGGILLAAEDSSNPFPGSDPEDVIHARTIRVIFRNDPTIPDGLYLLNLCNGDLKNTLGRTIGTVAGIYPQHPSC